MSAKPKTHVLLGDAGELVLFAVLVVEGVGGVWVGAEVEESVGVECLCVSVRVGGKMVRSAGV